MTRILPALFKENINICVEYLNFTLYTDWWGKWKRKIIHEKDYKAVMKNLRWHNAKYWALFNAIQNFVHKVKCVVLFFSGLLLLLFDTILLCSLCVYCKYFLVIMCLNRHHHHHHHQHHDHQHHHYVLCEQPERSGKGFILK